MYEAEVGTVPALVHVVVDEVLNGGLQEVEVKVLFDDVPAQ